MGREGGTRREEKEREGEGRGRKGENSRNLKVNGLILKTSKYITKSN